MAFTATRKEWSELYTFFRLLADGRVEAGQTTLDAAPALMLPVAAILRQEHDGPRTYTILPDTVRITSQEHTRSVERSDFDAAARLILSALHASPAAEPESPDGIEAFLDSLNLYDLEPQTTDRTDLSLCFWSPDAPPEGLRIQSRLAPFTPLLDGGRAANFKFEQTGIRFATPTVSKINATGDPDDVVARMLQIERLGGVLRYSDVADKIFRSNLSLLDLHMGRLLAETTRLMWLDGITRVNELTEAVAALNPLKIKDELITRHGFYTHKMKEFLLALAAGMRPAKIYNGTESAIAGMLFVDGSGHVRCYRRADRQTYADFLFGHTRLERGSTAGDKYGYLERENGLYYFRLNLKVGLLKR